MTERRRGSLAGLVASAAMVFAAASFWAGNGASRDTGIVDETPAALPWTDVHAFGAKGDGTSDDTNALQSAISHAATKTQGVVLLPPGTYKITARLKLYPNVDLVGVGVGFGSQIVPVETDAITILGSDWPGGFGFRNRIKGVTIMMHRAEKYRGIVIDHAYTVKLEDVFVFNAGTGGGISIASAGHVTIEDASVYGTGKGVGTGITVVDANVNLYNPDIEAFQHGLRVAGDQGVHIFGGHFERNAAYSVRYERASNNTIVGAKISAPNAQAATVGFFDSSTRNTVMGSRLDAHKTGFALYQDTEADQQNVSMQSYLNGRVSAGIRQK